jgi:glycosyltransferase involved in cell wall biosynthesis
MSRDKVLHLISSGGLYGAESVILNLSQEMRKSSFVPIVGLITEIEGAIGDLGEAARELGIETVSFFAGRVGIVACFFSLKKFLSEKNISIVHCHGYKATVLSFFPCNLLGIPSVTTCHLWANKGDFKLKFYHELEAMVMRALPAVIGVSMPICNKLIKKGVNNNKVHLIPNGINLANYRQYSKVDTCSFLRELGINEEDILVCTIGRLAAQKAQHQLVDAVNILRNKNIAVKCLIIGEGPLRGELESQRKQLGLEGVVFLPGFRDDIVNILELIDIFVLSSIDEGLPMVLLEAMAIKSAIITTSVGEIRGIIQHENNGLIFDVGDVRALVDSIELFYKDKRKRLDFAEAAFETYRKKYTSDVMARSHISLYREVLYKN